MPREPIQAALAAFRVVAHTICPENAAFCRDLLAQVSASKNQRAERHLGELHRTFAEVCGTFSNWLIRGYNGFADHPVPFRRLLRGSFASRSDIRKPDSGICVGPRLRHLVTVSLLMCSGLWPCICPGFRNRVRECTGVAAAGQRALRKTGHWRHRGTRSPRELTSLLSSGGIPKSIDELRALEAQQRKVVNAAFACTVSVQIGPAQGCGVIITGVDIS